MVCIDLEEKYWYLGDCIKDEELAKELSDRLTKALEYLVSCICSSIILNKSLSIVTKQYICLTTMVPTLLCEMDVCTDKASKVKCTQSCRNHCILYIFEVFVICSRKYLTTEQLTLPWHN